MRILIAGSRTLDKNKLISLFEIGNLLDMFNLEWPEEFVHGGCPKGTDAYAASVLDFTTPVKVFKADWNKYGKKAGPIRNIEMANYADALILIWDGTSRGSFDMKNKMLELDKPIYEIIIRSLE